jgi:hypothetical protein
MDWISLSETLINFYPTTRRHCSGCENFKRNIYLVLRQKNLNAKLGAFLYNSSNVISNNFASDAPCMPVSSCTFSSICLPVNANACCRIIRLHAQQICFTVHPLDVSAFHSRHGFRLQFTSSACWFLFPLHAIHSSTCLFGRFTKHKAARVCSLLAEEEADGGYSSFLQTTDSIRGTFCFISSVILQVLVSHWDYVMRSRGRKHITHWESIILNV